MANKTLQTQNSEKLTAQAYNHAYRIIAESYPDMSEERKQVQAARLAAKICRKEKH